MARDHPNLLLVEGKEDTFAIASLMAAHVTWGKTSEEWPVRIKDTDGVENLVAEGVISTHLKASGLRTLGIVVDANDEFDSRWQSIRDRCKPAFPDIPEELPTNGLVVGNDEGLRLGVWIMPDNRSAGMLESFLKYLVPGTGEGLWPYAQDAVTEAGKRGAPFSQNHRDKACVHTWLAWQAPPGHALGNALKAKCLDPHCEHARPFVEWFVTLFRLEQKLT